MRKRTLLLRPQEGIPERIYIYKERKRLFLYILKYGSSTLPYNTYRVSMPDLEVDVGVDTSDTVYVTLDLVFADD